MILRLNNSLLLLIVFLLNSILAVQENVARAMVASEIDQAENFFQDAKLSQQQHKPIFLYVSSTDCIYCKRLEKDIIGPMLKNGEYEKKIIMRKINLEDNDPIIDFNGKMILPADFLVDYQINATPTLLLLDHQGRQITNRIEGYFSADLFWYYLDKAIDKAVVQIYKLNDTKSDLTEQKSPH